MVDADLISQEHVTVPVETIHPPSDSNELGNDIQDVQDNTNTELLQANHPIEIKPSDPNGPNAGGDEESVSYYSE